MSLLTKLVPRANGGAAAVETLSPASANGPDWHTLTVGEGRRALETDRSAGLAATEAAARLASLGPNRLVDPPPDPAWKAFMRQFNDVLIQVLIAACVFSAVIGDTKDAVVIAVVVVLNAVVDFVQERRAEAALLALKRMLSVTTPVRRDGREAHIPPSISCLATSSSWNLGSGYPRTGGWSPRRRCVLTSPP